MDPAFEGAIEEQVTAVRTAKRRVIQAEATGDPADIPPAQEKLNDAYATYLALCQKALVASPSRIEDL